MKIFFSPIFKFVVCKAIQQGFTLTKLSFVTPMYVNVLKYELSRIADPNDPTIFVISATHCEV